METITIIILSFFILFGAISITLLIKKLLKIYFLLNLSMIVIILIFSFFIYNDVMDMKENFSKSSNLLLLEDNGKALAGFVMQEPPQILTEEKLDQYSTYLIDDDYSKVLGSSYKLLLIDIEIISNLNQESFIVENEEFTKNEILTELRTSDNLEYRTALFSMIFSNYIIGQGNVLYFLESYKKGNIFIYPETITFKLIKSVPLSLVRPAIEKTLAKA
tara:strand:- start:465 stop:1118 length:654 start_codon:yes stop_codon:yes gene_type:complete